MSWEIKYSAQALNDLSLIYEYIAYELLAPDTARGQVDRIMEAVRALDYMPMKYRVYEKEPWKSQGLRYFPVGNYLVFYIPKEKKLYRKYRSYYLWQARCGAAVERNNGIIFD